MMYSRRSKTAKKSNVIHENYKHITHTLA